LTIVTVTLNTSVDRTLEVPRFEVGGHLKGRAVRVQPAGKGVNVARCLARLGVPSVVTGLVGVRERELFREALAGTLAADELVAVADATRTNTTILDPELGTNTHIRETGFQVQEAEFEALCGKLRGLASADALVTFCGSLPPGIAPRGIGRLLAACQERGARVAADLNGSELGVAAAARPLLIKPNVEELAELLGRDLASATEAELLGAARSLCDRVGTVLLTRGKDGALAVSQGTALAGSAEVGAVRNTVGCGDAFLAGYLAGLWRGAAPEECLGQAVACGAASALADAAGQIEPRQVAELMERVEVRLPRVC